MCISRTDLLAHAVYAVRSQQIDCLLDKVSATTVEHPKAQVLQKLGLCGGCVQLSCGTEAIVCSKKTSNTVFEQSSFEQEHKEAGFQQFLVLLGGFSKALMSGTALTVKKPDVST